MTSAAQRPLFRDEAGVVPNVLAIGYAAGGYASGLALMAQVEWAARVPGVLLTAHAMLVASYLVHEAAHQTLFSRLSHNRAVGEAMSFLAGGSYASFDRIRHLHLRHHKDRVDVGCFDYKAFLRARPGWVRRLVLGLEWAYVPAVELVMHAQVLVRPFIEPGQRRYLPRVLGMLAARGALFTLLAVSFPSAAALYVAAYLVLLTLLNFFDAFHHTFEQFFVGEDGAIPKPKPDRAYEQANTYSNLLSVRWPALNLLVLNFCYHNAHHERAGVPWHRLPALDRELFPGPRRELLPTAELLRTFHANRLRRIYDDDYGALGDGPGRADRFVGAHGVSFFSVV